jgi:hypothetical protein
MLATNILAMHSGIAEQKSKGDVNLFTTLISAYFNATELHNIKKIDDIDKYSKGISCTKDIETLKKLHPILSNKHALSELEGTSALLDIAFEGEDKPDEKIVKAAQDRNTLSSYQINDKLIARIDVAQWRVFLKEKDIKNVAVQDIINAMCLKFAFYKVNDADESIISSLCELEFNAKSKLKQIFNKKKNLPDQSTYAAQSETSDDEGDWVLVETDQIAKEVISP